MKLVPTLLIIMLAIGFGHGLAWSADYTKHRAFFNNSIHNPELLKKIPAGMRIIALSFASDGLLRLVLKDEAQHKDLQNSIKKIVGLALGPYASPYRTTTLKTKLTDHNLYLAHLNIILSNYFLVTKDRQYYSLQHKINNHLLKRSSQSKNGHSRSFPNTRLNYPADQAAVIYSLHLFDKTYHQALSHDIKQKYITFILNKGLNHRYQLPVSELTGGIWYSHYPRGCANSFLIYYISQFEPKVAKQFWASYCTYYKGTWMSYTFFKEWVKDRKNKVYHQALKKWKKKHGIMGDVDSGPMFMNYGAAATGLALLSAKSVGDQQTYEELHNSITLGTRLILTINKKFAASLDTTLTKAIIIAAELL